MFSIDEARFTNEGRALEWDAAVPMLVACIITDSCLW